MGLREEVLPRDKLKKRGHGMTNRKSVSGIRQIAICAVFAMYASVAGAQYVSESTQKEQDKGNKNAKLISSLDAVKGKTFWYLPNPKAIQKVKFIEPDSNGAVPDRHRRNVFSVTSEASFVIDDYVKVDDIFHYFKVRFSDGKIGFLEGNLLASMDPDTNPVIANLYPTDGSYIFDFNEYIYPRPPQEILLAKKKAATEQAAKQAKSAAAVKARGGVRIGMTTEQALNSSWGKPLKINRTTNTGGSREQWVYSSNNYLYFESGILTSIQN